MFAPIAQEPRAQTLNNSTAPLLHAGIPNHSAKTAMSQSRLGWI
jgi:hypothetical protein